MLNENRDGAEKSAEVIERLMALRDELQQMKKQLDSLT